MIFKVFTKVIFFLICELQLCRTKSKCQIKNKNKTCGEGAKLKSCFCHMPRNTVDVVAILFPVIKNNNEKTVDGYGVQSNKLSKTVMAGDC